MDYFLVEYPWLQYGVACELVETLTTVAACPCLIQGRVKAVLPEAFAQRFHL